MPCGKKRATKAWAGKQVKEEKAAAKMYADRGFHDIAADERRHARKLSRFKGKR